MDDDDYIPTFEEGAESDEEDGLESDDDEYDEQDDAELLQGTYEGGEEENADAPDDIDVDDLGYLTNEGGDGGEDEDAPELFDEEDNALDVLQQMIAQPQGGDEQPFDLLNAMKRRVRDGARATPSKQRDTGVFGADVDDITAFASLGLERKRKKRPRKAKPRPGARRRNALTSEAEALLGQAITKYAFNELDAAGSLLEEVVRLSPNAPDAWETLGNVAQAQGDPKRALQCFILAATLKKDPALWRRLAAMSSELGSHRQAIACLNKVLASDRNDLEARWERAKELGMIGEHRKAIDALERIRAQSPADGELATELARAYHKVNDFAKATTVLEELVENHPANVEQTHVNILAELYMNGSEYSKALELIQQARGLLPNQEFSIDLQVKEGICATRLGDDVTANSRFAELKALHVLGSEDLHLAVADTMMQLGRPADAVPYFQAVHTDGSPEFDAPETWQKLAECLRVAEGIGAVIDLYEGILTGSSQEDPGHLEAALALSDLYVETGDAKADAMLQTVHDLAQDAGYQKAENLPLLLRRARLLKKMGQDTPLLDLMLPVLSSTIRHFESAQQQTSGLDRNVRRALKRRERMKHRRQGEEEDAAVFKGYTTRDRRKPHIQQADAEAEAIAAALTDAETEGEDEDGSTVLSGILRDPEQFDMLVATGRALIAQGQHRTAREILGACVKLFSSRWHDKSRRDVLQMLLAEAALGESDWSAALTCLKPVCIRWPSSVLAWNAFSKALIPTGGVAHTGKHLRSLRQKNPTSVPLMLLMGHYLLSQSHHAEALSEYFHAYRLLPEEPLVLLSIGLTYISQAMTKKVQDRNKAILRAFTFLQLYQRHRNISQESAYNMARAAHELNILHVAVPFYEQVLREKSQGPGLCLKREAAHNLALIYRSSGADHLARQVLREHFTV